MSFRKLAIILIAAIGFYLSYTLFGHAFPELSSDHSAGDYRPKAVTVIAWVVLVGGFIFWLGFACWEFFVDKAITYAISFCVMGATLLSWAKFGESWALEKYHRWAFDYSYSSITYHHRGKDTTISGEADRAIKQFPVRVLGPDGSRLILLLLIALAAGWFCFLGHDASWIEGLSDFLFKRAP